MKKKVVTPPVTVKATVVSHEDKLTAALKRVLGYLEALSTNSSSSEATRIEIAELRKALAK